MLKTTNDKRKDTYEMMYVKLGDKYIYVNDKHTMLKGGQGVEKRPNKIKENDYGTVERC